MLLLDDPILSLNNFKLNQIIKYIFTLFGNITYKYLISYKK